MATPWRHPRRASVLPIHLRVTATCPLCGHRVPLETFSEEATQARPLDPEFWRLWPRKPDGGRGFHWEQLDADELHVIEVDALEQGHFANIWKDTMARLTQRMIDWLQRFAVDRDGNRLTVRVERVESPR